MGGSNVNAITESIEEHHRLIIFSLSFVLVFMGISCIFHDVIQICHAVFGCDHRIHAAMAQ